ncbi:MAG: GDP-mannose 4,6-dehydratase [Candidatus Aenigmarchaeota archaeon]|nr:GDP-mannose 4,6-dehydratase [Candidatus Aenigmarchaeota archaeon]
MGERAFVTGITGFVGSHLAKALLDRGYEVVGLTRDFNKNKGLYKLGIDGRVVLVNGDLCDKDLLKRILTQYNIKKVFHMAAVSIVSAALKSPAETFKTNCYGTACLLEACKDIGTSSVLVASTDKVYGEGMNRKENESLDAEGMYECSKTSSEKAAKAFAHCYKMPIVVSRACNIYGAFDVNSRIVPNTVKAIINGKVPLIFKNDDSLREYIYVEDVCDALILLTENIEKTKGEVFNIGTGDVVGQEEMIRRIIKASGKNTKPDYVDKPVLVEIHQQSLDSSKIRNMFGWKPKHSLDQGLKKTWDAELAQ